MLQLFNDPNAKDRQKTEFATLSAKRLSRALMQKDGLGNSAEIHMLAAYVTPHLSFDVIQANNDKMKRNLFPQREHK